MVARLVLLVLVGVQLPDDAGVVHRQLLPQLAPLPIFPLLHPVVLFDQLPPFLLHSGCREEELLRSEHVTARLPDCEW